jgi:uncharacterized cupin superfamily protein
VTNLSSSAPHIHGAASYDDLADWGAQPNALAGASHSSGRLLTKGEGLESGLWICTPGTWTLSIPGDEFCHFVSGRARYTGDDGSVIEVGPGTCVAFPAGWSGKAEVFETMRNAYMFSAAEPTDDFTTAKVLNDPLSITETVDWGVIPTMREGESRVYGVLLDRGPDMRSETGMWCCTPGVWDCHVTSDEFCHFLDGRCTYVHESGDVIEVTPDTAAFFPKDWKGVCTVHETIRKVYMIR